ncbi:sensor histidine kinase [Pelagibacterium lacus]|uniref:sensor histidine kinase n=1 Tax=Pelagibacterium lacus TaxID=2282655 RepID=UPI00131422B4|nr:PAS domain S-box protein [Pelagibacterium lacus]
MAALVASSNDAIITKSLDGVVTSWNDAATRIFGYQHDEMIDQSITKLIPETLRSEEDEILRRIRRGERVEHFDTVRRTKDGSEVHVSLTISPLVDAQGRIMGASKIARDISDRKRSEERQQLLVNELKHRVKNTLSTVRAIAGQTYDDPQFADLNAAFTHRIMALAASTDLLIKDDWNGVQLRDLVDSVLLPFHPNDDAIQITDGAKVELTPPQASSLALALNELATNATKYGALSQPGGYVLLGWKTSADSPEMMVLKWVERGGPEVHQPQRSGFGTKILTFALKHELNADTELKYAPGGLEFSMRF